MFRFLHGHATVSCDLYHVIRGQTSIVSLTMQRGKRIHHAPATHLSRNMLVSLKCHYPLPRLPFLKIEMETLICWWNALAVQGQILGAGAFCPDMLPSVPRSQLATALPIMMQDRWAWGSECFKLYLSLFSDFSGVVCEHQWGQWLIN